MDIYPAIDLIAGRCVRLNQGDFARQTHYHFAPEQLALQYQHAGVNWLHVVDLDAAREPQQRQLSTLSRIVAATSLAVQCGGGIRSLSNAEELLQIGCQRVVIGSLIFTDPPLAAQLLDVLGPECLVFALDVRRSGSRYYPCVHGWQETTDIELFSTLQPWVARGLRHLLCTDISLDGTLAGSNVELYCQLRQQFPQLTVQASGGVGQLDDLLALAASGVAAAVVGKALLDGVFTLSQALELLEKNDVGG